MASTQEITIFNLLRAYGLHHGFQLDTTPKIYPEARVWQFQFPNGAETRFFDMFEDQIMASAVPNELSDAIKSNLDRELG
jgi:hypothetical protein